MALGTVCETHVVSIDKDSNLLSVSKLMQVRHVGSVVVTEKYKNKDIVVGMVTDRDLALTLGSYPKPQEIKVSQVMHSQPVTARKTEGIFEATLKMSENGVKRIPVVDDDGALFGIVSADDLLGLMAREMANLSKLTDVQVKKEKGIRLAPEGRIQA
jgi:signal-transduction protein with cAMP-binding, CBS, and nucleotidyltransferase domain